MARARSQASGTERHARPTAVLTARLKTESLSPELAPLARILSREEQLYEQLVEISRLERQAIVDNRLPDLKTAVERKHEALARLAELEDRRLRWLESYAGDRQLQSYQLTLAAIIEQSPARDRRTLGRLHQALMQRVDQLRELNQRTTSLLTAILGSIDASLRFLLSDDSWGSIYGAQGAIVAGTARQLLDRQA